MGKGEALKAEYTKVKLPPRLLNEKDAAAYLDTESQFNDGYREVF